MVAPTRPTNPYAGPRPGARPSRALAPTAIYRRPGVISVLAILQFIFGPLTILAGVAIAVGGLGESEPGTRIAMSAFGGAYAAFGTLLLVCGIGLWNLKGYGRKIQLVLSYIGLLGIPVGTILSILILVYLYKPGVKVLFSGIPPSRLNPAEAAEVARLQQSSGVPMAILAVVLLLATVAFVGILAAIAIPSILRARVSANEAAAIADVRSVISAEVAYSSSNGGNYDGLECLLTPAQCIPGYPLDGPSFLYEELPPVKNGYHRELILGPPIDRSEVAFANLSPTSAASFAYLAYPVNVGVTGFRSFCGDFTGRVCVDFDGSRPEVIGGRCDPGCIPLE